MQRFKFLFIAVFLFLTIGACSRPEPTDFDFTAIDVSRDPVQIKVGGLDPVEVTLSQGNCTILPVAEYKIAAMVVGKKFYSSGWGSEISPVDLALAWGKMPDPEYDKYIKYRQSNRWYYYRYQAGAPFDNSYVINHSSNHHIIPANENVSNAVKSVKRKEHIYMEGYLVRIEGTFKGGRVWWRSSLKRSDTGDGSCEVFYVEKVKIGDKVYE